MGVANLELLSPYYQCGSLSTVKLVSFLEISLCIFCFIDKCLDSTAYFHPTHPRRSSKWSSPNFWPKNSKNMYIQCHKITLVPIRPFSSILLTIYIIGLYQAEQSYQIFTCVQSNYFLEKQKLAFLLVFTGVSTTRGQEIVRIVVVVLTFFRYSHF